jgi:TfoX/Sxy family transcriptional regulator of competence genes
MAFDSGLVARVADAIAQIGERSIRQKNVFGGRGFLAGSSTFVIVWDEDLIVKTPRAEYQAALAMPGVTPFTPDGEKPMSSWVVVAGETVADDPELVEWVRRGLRGVRGG